MGIVWSTTTRTLVSVATAVTFSVKCFNPLKLSSVRKHLQKVASYFLFIREHLIIIWSLTVNLIAVTTLLLTSGLHCCWQRISKKNTKCFHAVRISISLAILSEIFIQISNWLLFLRKQTWMFFFPNTVHYAKFCAHRWSRIIRVCGVEFVISWWRRVCN